jgi:hypothetical protein
LALLLLILWASKKVTPLKGGTMKSFIFISLFLSIQALADATFKIDGSGQSFTATIFGERTHTEYREETESYTCYEEVCDGSREVCHTEGGGQECGITPSGYQCYPVPGHTECDTVPVCHSVPDTCYRTVQVPYQVKDWDVQNELILVAPRSQLGALDEVLEVEQTGESVRVSARSTSKIALIYSKKEYQTLSFDGSLKKMATVVTLSYADLIAAANPLLKGMSELSADNKEVSFTLGRVYRTDNLSFFADISRYILVFPKRLIQRALTAEEYTIEDVGDDLSKVKINLEKLGIADKIKGKTIHFEISTKLDVPLDNLVNRQDLPDLQEEKKLKQKLSK